MRNTETKPTADKTQEDKETIPPHITVLTPPTITTTVITSTVTNTTDLTDRTDHITKADTTTTTTITTDKEEANNERDRIQDQLQGIPAETITIKERDHQQDQAAVAATTRIPIRTPNRIHVEVAPRVLVQRAAAQRTATRRRAQAPVPPRKRKINQSHKKPLRATYYLPQTFIHSYS